MTRNINRVVLRIVFLFSLRVLFCLQARAAIVQPSQAAAVFNLNSVTGWVRFYDFESFSTIVVNLEGLTEDVMEWSIHSLPVDETLRPSERCSLDYLGSVYDPQGVTVEETCEEAPCRVGDLSGRFGTIMMFGTAIVNDTQRAITLQGQRSIVGRSVRVQIGSESICATVRSKTETALKVDVVTMKADFISPAAGTVYFRQNDNEPATIFGKLFWVNGDAARDVQWTISDELLDETYRVGSCGTFNMSNVYDELTDRHGMITVSDTARPYSDDAFLVTDDSGLKLVGPTTTIESRTLLLREGDSVVGCAPIVLSEVIEAFQYPDFHLQIRQASPYENSTLVQTTGFDAALTHTILNAAWMTNGLCSLTDEVYNPLGTATDELSSTPDSFAYGDISGKFASLLGPSQELALPELPMYGEFSMLGLTARHVMDSGSNSYRICDALVPLKDNNTLLAKATFEDGSVRGAIYFLQRQDPQFSGQPGVTNIIVDLYYEDGTVSETTGHIWRVQENAGSSTLSEAYNPFNVVRGSDYANECGPSSQLRCEYGDLTGKHGELTIGPLGSSRKTKAVVDTNLHLDGEYKIVGQTIGVYAASSSPQPLAFAEIELVKTSDPADLDVIIAFPETSDFERVAFTKELVEMASLQESVDPSDLLILHEEVGTLQSAEEGSVCAVALLKVMSSSVEQANTYASTLQSSVCDKLANNGCMKQLPEYMSLCSTDMTTTASAGAHAVISLGVTTVVVFMAALLGSVLF